ncbi:hypothetical protein RYX36_013834 [Vicia faba]
MPSLPNLHIPIFILSSSTSEKENKCVINKNFQQSKRVLRNPISYCSPYKPQTIISTPDNLQSNGDQAQTDRTRGAKSRKPSPVKRFKKEECASQTQTVDTNDTTANEISAGGKVELDWTQNACNIVKILKPIGYLTSLSSYMQDVSVTFMDIRSDGTEVMVDNKYLKTNKNI